MKNIIRMIAILVATALVILLMVKGLSIGSIKVYSISEIIEENSKLDNEINDLNKLKNEDYKKSLDSLSSSTKSLETSKQSYLDEASISTDSEIKEATISQKYSMEYLWNKVGSYATEEGVNLKWEVQSSGSGKYTLNFTVVGSYIAIINYVYDVENDSDLGFTILNFKMSGSDSLTATFSVHDVSIKAESVTAASNMTSMQDTSTQSLDSSSSSTNQ